MQPQPFADKRLGCSRGIGLELVRKFFGAHDFELQVVEKEVDFRGRRLKKYLAKKALFQQLFCADYQEVKGDWAICNKRFVRRFHRHVIKERRWKMMEYELMDDGKLEMGGRETKGPQMTPISQNEGDGALGRFHAGNGRLTSTTRTRTRTGGVVVCRSLSHPVAVRRSSFFTPIPGFERQFGFDQPSPGYGPARRREYSRLFPPFPPLTAFGGSFHFLKTVWPQTRQNTQIKKGGLIRAS
jgi:hypothetical protein